MGKILLSILGTAIITFIITYSLTAGRLGVKCDEAWERARDADALVKLMALDHRLYNHLFSVSVEGDALEGMGMIDSTQNYRLFQLLQEMGMELDRDDMTLRDVLSASGKSAESWRETDDVLWTESMEAERNPIRRTESWGR